MESIVVAIITGGLSLIGVIIATTANGRKMQSEMRASQAVMQERIDELTREVRKHNNFAERMPVVEEQIKVANHRIADLERKEEAAK